ncbi:MAG: hypothetical protein EBZ49_00370 [Proteobacteria bacterium]|nr:hypothetical protein [Pseudomonadota bacterium]
MSDLIGPDGKPIPKTLCVEYGGRLYPYRLVNPEQLNNKDPRIGLLGVLIQMGDQTQLTWLSLLALAKDIYSRNPKGTREFQKLAESVGLVIIDGERHELDVAQELGKI